MLLMPITWPRASARGPPELPGASRTSACTQRWRPPSPAGPMAWTIPIVSAPTTPKGLPTASTSSPTRRAPESATGAAGRSEASTASAARSRCGSRAVTVAARTRPSHSSTVARGPGATCAFVMIRPSGRQMTPDPPPGPRPRTCTVERRRRAATAASSSAMSGRAPDAASSRMAAMATLLPPLRTLADRDGESGHLTTTDDRGGDGLAHALGIEQRLHVVRVGNGLAVERDQNVPNQRAGLLGRPTRLDGDDDQPTAGGQTKLALEGVGHGHRLHPDAEIATCDAPRGHKLVRHALDRRGGDCQGPTTRQTRRVDANHAALHVRQRAAGKAGVQREVRAHEPVDLSAAPGAPGLAQVADHADAGAQAVLAGACNGQHHVANLERGGISDLGRGPLRALDLEHGQVRARVAP